MSRYTLEAGRSIRRDGLPFIHIGRNNDNEHYVDAIVNLEHPDVRAA